MAEVLGGNKPHKNVKADWVMMPIVGKKTTFFNKETGLVEETSVVEDVKIINKSDNPFVTFETANSIYTVAGIILEI